MTTQHFSISHTDETGTDTYLTALVDGTFHASRNSETPEELAQVEDACRFLAEDDAALELALDSGRTVRKVDADTLMPTLLAELKAAEADTHIGGGYMDADLRRAQMRALALVQDIKHMIGHLMAPTGKAQVTLTIGRETRTIAITSWATQPDVAYSDNFCGAFQKGPGCKVWRERIRFYAKDGRWVANTHMTILNRFGYQLNSWADKAPAEARSQHNSSIG
ncbi:MAG: hypothetical protein WC326_01880 [Candidatus Delongbacteria bacterium]